MDWRAVLRAARDNLRARHVVSGASTLTMQLARLLRPAASGHTWSAKALQVLWALRLEGHLTKQAILEQYLNRVPLGQGTIGVAAAARLYFDASATRLSLAQTAFLADIPHIYETPTGPYRPRNYDRAFRGPVRAREALASSYNVPAIELTNRVGDASLLRTLQLAGFASLDRTADYYGLGL